MSDTEKPSHDGESIQKIRQILSDPSASKWLKQGLTSALRRDPAEAKADAYVMSWVLEWRWQEMQKKGGLQ